MCSRSLNALRALRGDKQVRRVSPANDVADRFRFEHKEFAPEVLRIRTVADRLGQMTPAETRQELEAVRYFLLERLPEHEEEEEYGAAFAPKCRLRRFRSAQLANTRSRCKTRYTAEMSISFSSQPRRTSACPLR